MDAGDGEHELQESSSERRERLLALRSSAASASPAEPPPPAPAGGLLPDPDLAVAGDHRPSSPRPPQRFGYYTNPAAAFSSSSAGGAANPAWPHKRKSPPVCYSPSPAPPPPPQDYGDYGRNNRPPHQHHLVSSPVHPPSPMSQNAPWSRPWRNPMQFQDPKSGYQGTPPGAPSPWGPHSGPAAQRPYPDSPSFGFRHPPPGRGGSPMNYGPRGSPYSSYGQGRGPNYYGSQGSRARGGRGGVGFQNCSGWQDRRNYFSRSMIDDPWEELQPVVGNILVPRGASKPWLPESLRAKKDAPAQGQIKPPSTLSLAEYLDLSFNEVSSSET